MRSLPVPELVAAEVFDAISTAKDAHPRQLLSGARNRVLARFEQYAIDALHGLQPAPWNGAEKAALVLCYESAVPPRNDLRRSILAAAGQYCPYCGMDRPTTVDHYIPKDEHPEFS